ncbi:PACE efflux transporter [Catenovulum sp. 2E275]|uniref:PACE efflux transporter n=1 Tax=Catenovulum sp. 2E275 TaxID=2980497 RepID=UPI0021CE61BA|nr:PACE efflux transporter [Catenovulum sp. 2E275]MCU4674157.1 PACE efflux transporter [Catenovulum sp. 2E275]
MSNKERIFHSMLFEIVALIILIPLGSLLSELSTKNLTVITITLGLIAMCWNFVYNKIFDHFFGENRIDRGILIRIVHGVLFEAGLVVLTLPIIMYLLNIDFLNALKLDLGIIIFFLIFAIIFNWSYDKLKYSLFESNINNKSLCGEKMD